MKIKMLLITSISTLLIACSTQKSEGTVVAKDSASSENTVLIQQGKSLFETKCAQCHGLPKRENFSNEQWKIWVEKMIPKSKITATHDVKAIRTYLYQ